MSLWVLIPLIYFGIGVLMIPVMMYAAYKLEGTTEYDVKDCILVAVGVPAIWPAFCFFMAQEILSKYEGHTIVDLNKIFEYSRKIFDRQGLEDEEIDEYNDRIGS